MMHDILSRHLRIPEHRVRVINKDVGGSFGLKIHTYPDEIATCALAVMLGRAGEVPGRPHRVVPDRHPLARPPGHRGGRGEARRDHPRACASTTWPRSAPSRCIRARAWWRAARSCAPRPAPTASATTRPAAASSSRTRRRCRSTAPSATPSPRSSWRPWWIGWPASSALDPVEVRRRNLLTADMYPVHRAHRALLREALARGVARRGAGAGRATGRSARSATGCARAASTAGSASASSSTSRCPAPRPTAPAARASRRRTAPRSASSRAAS